jgi:hypothetical protein
MHGGWRRLHSEELHDFYASPNVIRVVKSRRMKWADYVARMGGVRNAYEILVGIHERTRTLGRPRCRCEDIRMYFRERGWVGRCGLDSSASG